MNAHQIIAERSLPLALAVAVLIDVAIVAAIVAVKLLRERAERIAERTRAEFTEQAIEVADGTRVTVQLPPFRSVAGRAAMETILSLIGALKGEARDRLAGVLDSNGYIVMLQRQLRARDAAARAAAASLLGGTASRLALPALTNSFRDDPSPEVRIAAAEALSAIGDPSSAQVLLEGARDPARYQELRLAGIIAAMGATAVPALESALDARDTRITILVLDILSDIAAVGDVERVRHLLTHRSPEVRGRAATLLGSLGAFECARDLILLSGDRLWFVRLRAIKALMQLGTPAEEPLASHFLDAMTNALHDETWYVRRNAAAALNAAGERGQAVLRHSDSGVARSALGLGSVLRGRDVTTLL